MYRHYKAGFVTLRRSASLKNKMQRTKFTNKEKGMNRLKAILQDDTVKAAIVFVAIWSGIVAAVLIPLSPML